MTRNVNREESLRIAAEKMRQKREKEEREENEFYERITSGTPWLMFKAVVVFCSIIALITTIDQLFDGPTEKITEESWEVDKNWEYTGHAVLNVKGYMFTPSYLNWWDHLDNSLEMTYSPILRTGKKLHFESTTDDTGEVKSFVVIRSRSIFNWFPFFQLFLLIPLITFIFKRKSPLFNFARIASFVFVFPGTLIAMFFTIM